MTLHQDIRLLRKHYRFDSGGKIEKVFHDENTNTVHLEGWALCKAEDPALPPDSILVILDGICIYETNSFPIHRPDVENYFHIPLSTENRTVGTGF